MILFNAYNYRIESCDSATKKVCFMLAGPPPIRKWSFDAVQGLQQREKEHFEVDRNLRQEEKRHFDTGGNFGKKENCFSMLSEHSYKKNLSN